MLNARYEAVPTYEMKRRQDAILKVMDEKGVDALVLCNFSDMIAGPFKYFTDRTNAYTMAAILSKEGIVIYMSAFDMPPELDPVFKENGEALPVAVCMAPYLPGIDFNKDRYSAAMTHYIKKSGFKKIAWGSFTYTPAHTYQYLIDNNPGVEFVDFTDEVNDIRLVCSEYDIQQRIRCCDLHDRLAQACYHFIRPNLTPYMLNLELMDAAAKMGAIEFNTGLIRHWRTVNGKDIDLGQDTQMQKGDYIWVLMEVTGKNGEWGEVARTYRLGEEPEQRFVDICNNILYVQHEVAKAAVPGAIPEDIFELNNKLLASFGYPIEERLCIHGQTYDIVDLPLFVKGDKKPLKENMFFANHPAYQCGPRCFDAPYFNFTDNYLVKEGGAVRLNKTEQKIFVVGI